MYFAVAAFSVDKAKVRPPEIPKEPFILIRANRVPRLGF